jgi:V/A-type H+-transporting ATPase subunit K
MRQDAFLSINIYKRYPKARSNPMKRSTLTISLSVALLAFLVTALSAPVHAQTTSTNPAAGDAYLGAAIAFGLAAFGAGIGVGTSGSAAIAAVTEKAEVRTTALIFVVLAEAIAIYGFVIAFTILGKV